MPRRRAKQPGKRRRPAKRRTPLSGDALRAIVKGYKGVYLKDPKKSFGAITREITKKHGKISEAFVRQILSQSPEVQRATHLKRMAQKDPALFKKLCNLEKQFQPMTERERLEHWLKLGLEIKRLHSVIREIPERNKAEKNRLLSELSPLTLEQELLFDFMSDSFKQAYLSELSGVGREGLLEIILGKKGIAEKRRNKI